MTLWEVDNAQRLTDCDFLSSAPVTFFFFLHTGDINDLWSIIPRKYVFDTGASHLHLISPPSGKTLSITCQSRLNKKQFLFFLDDISPLDLEKWQLCAGRSRWEAANLCRRRSTTHRSYFRISYSAEASFPPTDAQIIVDAFESQDVNSLDALWQTTPSSPVWIWKEARLLQQNEVLLLHPQILARTSQTFYFLFFFRSDSPYIT